MFAATVLVNSGAEAFDRLNQRRLIDLGFPEEPAPIVWFTALGIATLAIGWVALRVVEERVHGEGAARHLYVIGCVAGAIGLVVLAYAPNDTVGMIGVLFVSGIAWTVIRSVSVIWVNRRATSDVRATLQSFLTQVESTGEIVGGITLGIVAQSGSISVALTCSAALLAVAGITVDTVAGGASRRARGAAHLRRVTASNTFGACTATPLRSVGGSDEHGDRGGRRPGRV